MRTMVVAVSFCLLFAPVHAQEPDEVEKELKAFGEELDGIVAAVEKLAPGDKRGINTNARTLNGLFNKLLNFGHKSRPEWRPLVVRAGELDDRLMEMGSGKKPEPGVPDEKTKEGLQLLDAAQKEHEAQPAGDRAAMNALLPQVKRARSVLLASGHRARRSIEWIDGLARSEDLLARVKARGTGAPEGEPLAKLPDAPAKPEAPKPEAPKPEAPKPEAPKPEAPKPAADSAMKLVEGERPPKDPALKGRMPDYGVYEHLDKAAKKLKEALGDVKGYAEKGWDTKPLHESVDRLEKGAASYGPERSDVQWVGRWVAAYRERVKAFEAEVKRLREEKAAGAAPSDIKLVKGERPPDDPSLKDRLPDWTVYEPMDKAVDALVDAESRTEEWAQKGWNLDDLTNRADRIEKALGQDPRRSDVQWAQRWLAAYRARVAAFGAEVEKLRSAAAAARAAEAKDVDARLDELDGYFNAKTFDSSLALPLTEARVREWIKQLEAWDAIPAKALAELDKVVKDHPRYANDDRIRGLRIWFKETMPKRIEAGIEKTMGRYKNGPGHVTEALSRVEHVIEDPAGWVKKYGANDEAVEKVLQNIPPAIEACAAKVLFAREYLGKPDEEHEALLPRLQAMATTVESGANQIFENTRMPPARSTDPSLIAFAKELLADPATESEATPYKRLVLESGITHHSEQRSRSWTEGEWVYTKRWTEEYEMLLITTAEKDGEDWRLCFYQMRRYTKALPGESTGKWYCAQRWWGRRIKEENIDK